MNITAPPKNIPTNNLVSLRDEVQILTAQTESEETLIEVLAILRGIQRPCAYTHEEFVSNIKEAEEDYKAGRCISHEELFAQYGI